MSLLKFKVNRWVWVAGVAVFVVLFGLWFVRFRQVNEQRELLGLASSTVGKLSLSQIQELTRRKTEIEGRLSVASAKVEAERANLFSSAESIGASRIVFETAATVGVEVVEVKSSGLSGEMFQGLPVQALSLSVKARGDMPTLVRFVSALGLRFPTSLIKSVDIGATDPAVSKPDQKGQEMIAQRTSADIVLSIYSYEGGSNG